MILVCKHCEKEFKTSHSCAIYCSRSCRNKANPVKYTKKMKEKLSKVLKGKNAGKNNAMYGMSGELSPAYGTKRTDECRKRLSEMKIGKRMGEESSNWKGGISNDPYPSGWNILLKESIRTRDNFICQECGTHQDELDRNLDVHHIDYDKDNLDPNNLISLCRTCHIKTNFNREDWQEYFENIMEVLNEK